MTRRELVGAEILLQKSEKVTNHIMTQNNCKVVPQTNNFQPVSNNIHYLDSDREQYAKVS